ncbi:chromatin assembly factor 1 subunit A [Anopheles ziemanni]|uniref:chromatin assembly factor 1 subunit A n=1 Tax=Anopheles coustani TaxID=139045 RepID=UPI00265A8E02|nr:chromatin assembly factor 1 subunit A [Anopheles coustani]XP_058174834.1 chromatin assembly factor 1 subunit A [Anopheles ziemanni]
METVLAAGSSKRPESCSVRKLKQSRLPFQALSPGMTSSTAMIKPSVEVVESRKRRPSSEELELGHASKIGRVLVAKENEKHIEVEVLDSEKSVHKDHEELASDALLSPTASSVAHNLNDSTKLNKRHKNRHTRNKDNNKIFIKLPKGKQKRLTSNKVKSSIKKHNQSETPNLNDTSREIVLLDDTDLSEEIEDDHTSNIANEILAKAKQTVPSSAALNTSNELNSSSTSDLDKESSNHENEHHIATCANEIVPSIREEKHSGDITLTKLFSKEKSPKNIPLDKSDIVGLSRSVSDFNSSEEDIYMLCTPNSKVIPKPGETQKLTPKQIARREEHKKRAAKKLEEKEEKRRKAQEEKEEKAREKEEQDRQRRREREEKEEQKKKEREEKEELRRKEREEKEEQKRKEREEKEDIKRKEREEKEKKRQAEIDLKNEEKRQKEEERRKKEEQKEEERKRKEEEKEAEEKRKQKVAQAFTSFFVKKNASGSGTSRVSDEENSFESSLGASTNTGTSMSQQRFMPFCVKGDMRLAPITRRALGPLQKAYLEQILANVGMKPSAMAPSELYLGLLRDGICKPRKAGRTWSMEEEEDDNDDIMIVDDTVCHQIEEDPAKMKQKMKAKFFLFEENRRPPFRGTWRKRSSCIGARRPFAEDKKFFDYDVDSDEEWEEEEPGESLHGSDDEKDVDPEEDYEVDNEFFVPHGHLSDEELQPEEEEGGMDDNSPEAQKAKLKIMQLEFVAEMKKKTEKIKPRLIGCIWENPGEKVKENNRANHVDRHVDCSAIIWKMLNDRAMLYDADEPISFTLSSTTNPNRQVGQELEVSSPSKETEKGPKKVRITDDAVKDLVRLVHGNVNNRKFLVREFQTFWSHRNETADEEYPGENCGEVKTTKVSLVGNGVEFSLESISNKIREIAEWGACPLEGPMMGKLCWTVDKDILAQYGLELLTIPNVWKYHLKGNKQPRMEKKSGCVNEDLEQKIVHSNNSPKKRGIAKTMKKFENDSTLKSLAGSSVSSSMVSIKKFTKVIAKDERIGLPLSDSKTCDLAQENTVPAKAGLTSASGGNHNLDRKQIKKRVQLLMSVPRGQAINQSTKTILISQFLANGNKDVGKPCTENVTTSGSNNQPIEIE